MLEGLSGNYSITPKRVEKGVSDRHPLLMITKTTKTASPKKDPKHNSKKFQKKKNYKRIMYYATF